MTNRVHAGVQLVQAAGTQAAPDRASHEAELKELGKGHDAVLPEGEFRKLRIQACAIPRLKRWVPFDPHTASKGTHREISPPDSSAGFLLTRIASQKEPTGRREPGRGRI